MPETPEERLERERGMLRQRAALFKKLVEKFGPRVLDVVEQHVIDGARVQMASAPLPRRDLDAVIALWDSIGDYLDYTVEERTPERLKFHTTRCFWAEEMRKLGASEIGYAFQCAWDEGYCQGLNPNMRFTRTKTLMQGDDCCDHVYELESS